MTRAEFDAHCAAMRATTHVVQWGGASVWKIGGKIFAICSTWGEGDAPRISFKCSDLAFEVLRDQPGAGPAPYLGRFKWIQIDDPDALPDAAIRDHIDAAYAIVVGKLTKAERAALAKWS